MSVISYQLSVISHQFFSRQESVVRSRSSGDCFDLFLPLPHFPTSPLPHFPTSPPLTPNPLFLLLNCFLNHQKI
ncbi:MAG: hypothetical protein DWQ58_23360 [Microcystis aeruginosa TA09]|nr:MAG: hypothetical protein DWQ58_23360 [Microcystis aeruginosa TA09]